MALSSRRIKRREELFEIFSGAKDIFIDGTERPIQRPKDEEKQKKAIPARRRHILVKIYSSSI